MRYTNEDFIRLISAVEHVGGDQLDETCHADEILYEMPNGPDRTELTHGCEKEVVFSIPYDATQTVLVPEPVLEPDPERAEWTDNFGEPRITRRTKTVTRTDGTKEPIIEVVERPGEDVIGNSAVVLMSSVNVCAVGDNLGMWPRFRQAMKDERTG